MSFSPSGTLSSYLPADFDLPATIEGMRDFMNKRERLTATIVNIKENAQYEQRELLSGQQWFSTPANGAIKTSYVFRETFDLVALNGGSIPNGESTTITLQNDPTMGTPVLINIPITLLPVHGFGGCTNSDNFIFINDPSVYVQLNIWTSMSQTIIITNNSGSALTQCYWCFEYIKT